MKPAPFEYAAPESLEEALDLLGEDAKPLAGGQSLVPLLNFRLARPRLLVDLNGVPGLGTIRRSGGSLFLGALVRQAALERSRIAAEGWPLLHQAIRFVGHAQTRARGTIGGSVVHADPAAELPCVLATLGARFHVRSRRGSRTLAAEELFVGPLQTSLEPDELLVEIEVPEPRAGARAAFAEHARTHGDFALAGVALLAWDDETRIGLLGVAPTPVVVGSLDEARIADAYLRSLVHELLSSVT